MEGINGAQPTPRDNVHDNNRQLNSPPNGEMLRTTFCRAIESMDGNHTSRSRIFFNQSLVIGLCVAAVRDDSTYVLVALPIALLVALPMALVRLSMVPENVTANRVIHFANDVFTYAARVADLIYTDENWPPQAPNNMQRDKINSYIKQNLTELKSEDGISINKITLELPNGADLFTCEDFDPASTTEWCLLSKGGNKTILITANSAERLINSGNEDPFKSGSATPIVRGQAMLDLLGLH